MKPIHLAIAIPGEAMPIESVRAFGRLLLELTTNPPLGVVQVSQSMFASSMLPYARSKVIAGALSGGATHVLCLDADMTYPPNIAHRLLEHGRPFVACNATTRRPPIRWVAKDKAGEIIQSDQEKAPLTKASVVGIAVALIQARVFTEIGNPLFNFEYTENGWRGEDVWFCDRAIACGFVPMIDNRASLKIGHVGTRECTWELLNR
jgi:hypothetical protein